MSPPAIASAFVCAAVALISCVVHSEPAPARSAPWSGDMSAAQPATPVLDDASAPEAEPGIETLSPPQRLLLSPTAGSADTAVCVTYAVGGRDELAGGEGLSELVGAIWEQSARKPDGASYAELLRARGGSLEQRVLADFSQYCVTAPAAELELAIAAVSATLDPPTPSAEALDRAWGTLETRRSALESGYGAAALKLGALGFQGYAPYDHEGTWELAQLRSLPSAALVEFHARHYRPDNAVVSISGDFASARAEELVAKYLASKQPAARAVRTKLAALPRQTTERFLVVESPSVETPAAYYGWVVSGVTPRDLAALNLLEVLLTQRGVRALGRDGDATQLLAAAPNVWHTGHQGPELFGVRLIAAKGVRLEVLSAALEAQLLRWQQAGPSRDEYERAVAELRSQLDMSQASNLRKAQQAGELALSSRRKKLLDELGSLTPSDVGRVIARELTRQRRNVVELYPPGMLKAPEIVRQHFHVVGFGETLTGIARRYATTIEALATANTLSAKKAIFPGQKLKLPPGARLPVLPKKTLEKKAKPLRTHRVARGDTLIGIAKRYRVSPRDLAKQNGQSSQKAIRIGQTLTIPPSP